MQLQEVLCISSPVVNISSIAFNPSSFEKELLNVSQCEESSQLISLADAFAIMENALNLSKVAVTMQKVLPGSPVSTTKCSPCFHFF